SSLSRLGAGDGADHVPAAAATGIFLAARTDAPAGAWRVVRPDAAAHRVDRAADGTDGIGRRIALRAAVPEAGGAVRPATARRALRAGSTVAPGTGRHDGDDDRDVHPDHESLGQGRRDCDRARRVPADQSAGARGLVRAVTRTTEED